MTQTAKLRFDELMDGWILICMATVWVKVAEGERPAGEG